ncbi:CopG family transcriptional regulator [Brevundimonas sp. LM2]|uniref:ribbon-helix-helix domain-containing protein n=1 Tax=Brevundimonas sp. LM2 TaxID=1938605 RepID=UPI0009871FEA|nr:CopG family transcriptional regulator [Brevundimonas sp. LM2]
MKKIQLSIYLEPDLLAQLEAFADRRGRSRSLVAEAAIAAFLSPDTAERSEAVLVRRLDRLSRQADRTERDLGIALETLALFIRHWLTVTPPTPESGQDAARARGQARYADFLEALGRRLASSRRFTRDLALDVAASAPSDPSIDD